MATTSSSGHTNFNNGTVDDFTYTGSANTAPGAPTIGTATTRNAQATVTFTAPGSTGGSAITGYTVTSIPAGGVDSNSATTGLSHVVTGLVNGTSYTFTVTATNAAGTSVASAASNAVTPVAPLLAEGTGGGGGSFVGGGVPAAPVAPAVVVASPQVAIVSQAVPTTVASSSAQGTMSVVVPAAALPAGATV